MFALNQPTKKEIPTYIVFDKFASNETCKEIISLSKVLKEESGMQAAEASKRISEIYWLPWSTDPGIDGLYQNLGGGITKANDDCWGFHLGGFLEPLQLTHYTSEKKGHYDWHSDRADKGIMMNRKISGTLLLNDNFDGGEFELFDVKETPELQRGSLLLFPSYHIHRVKPVTGGERWSLVMWVTGPPWI